MLVSLYSLAAYARRRDALIGFGVGGPVFRRAGTPRRARPRHLGPPAVARAARAAWAFGDAIRSRGDQQREHLEAAVTAERLRIARELHDVVAHSMSLIAVQAGVGAHVIRTDADAAERSLEVIADTSRQALEQTRSMLGLLRDTSEDGTRRHPGSRRPPALVQDVGAAGLDVSARRRRRGRRVHPAVSLTAYRVVQESLTNVVKHSAASTATVTVRARTRPLDIEVVDPGPPRATWHGPGHGLVGLGSGSSWWAGRRGRRARRRVPDARDPPDGAPR